MPFDSQNYQPTDPVLKCLQDARQWLSDPALWAKENVVAFTDNRGPGCSLNWIGRTSDEVSLYCDSEAYLRRALPRGRNCVADFNDDPTTTHADILALFDRAIAARRTELLAQQSAS